MIKRTKLLILILVLTLTCLFTGCTDTKARDTKVDIDLTVFDATMLYSMLYQICANPDEYMGKTIKLTGDYAESCGIDGTVYPTCVIMDATACCAQGIEFITKDGKYPVVGNTFTVLGDLEAYTDLADGNQYIHLVNAQVFDITE